MASSNTTDYAAGAAALRGRLDLRRAAGDSVRAAYSNSNRTD